MVEIKGAQRVGGRRAVPEEPFTKDSIAMHNQISVILSMMTLANGPGIWACSPVPLEAGLHITQFPCQNWNYLDNIKTMITTSITTKSVLECFHYYNSMSQGRYRYYISVPLILDFCYLPSSLIVFEGKTWV